MNRPRATAPASDSTLKLILAWGFVGIPLLWGVLVTLQNALKLFA